MIMRMLAASLLAGLIAGTLVAAIQHFTTVPLIIAAEAFEAATPHAHEAAGVAVHEHAASVWQPADGMPRTLATAVTTIATAVGFAALVLGAMLTTGATITARGALAWGLAGFVATGLAPAAGLAPALPGMILADTNMRQLWWLGTALATAAALFLFFRPDRADATAPVWQQGMAILLILAPHLIGAPQPATLPASAVPAGIIAQFATVSLAVQAVLWAGVGFGVGAFWHVLSRHDSLSPQGAGQQA